MNILDNYIGKSVFVGVFGVFVVVSAMFIMISFTGEFDDFGVANYTTGKALLYVFLRTPRQVTEMFPMVAILGSMVGLGALASRSELVVVRASGVSRGRIIFSILRATFLLMLIAFLVGEVLGAPAEHYAKQMRLQALSKKVSFNTNYGLWIRDGRRFIHVQQVDEDEHLIGVSVYEFNERQEMQIVLRAAEASTEAGNWVLRDVQQSELIENSIKTRHVPEMHNYPLIPLKVIRTVSVTPGTLPVWKLFDYIKYLEKNGLDASRYKLAFWNKVMMPLATFAMVFLSVPFMFGSMRGVSVGQRIVLGFILGMVFFLVSRIAGQFGLVYDIHPLVTTMVPPLLVFFGTAIYLRRTT